MKKSIKKIIATILTAAMAMSVGMPTFAAEELDITIDNYGLSAESIAFLEAHNVGLAQFLDSSIATENIINTISNLSDTV